MYSREKIELFPLATEEVPRVAEPDGVPQEAWIRVGAVQEIVRTPRLLSAWVKRPMRSALLGPNCYKERLFRHRRGITCSLPCRT